MMYCIRCTKDVAPSIDLNERGIALTVCPVCQQVLGDAHASTPTPDAGTLANEAQMETDAAFRQRMVHGDPSSLPGAPKHKPPATVQQSGDIVQSARERLTVIEAELTRMADLQREHRKLAAMVAAADAADADIQPLPVLVVQRGYAGVAPSLLPTMDSTIAAE